jgi:hypothetical protein
MSRRATLVSGLSVAMVSLLGARASAAGNAQPVRGSATPSVVTAAPVSESKPVTAPNVAAANVAAANVAAPNVAAPNVAAANDAAASNGCIPAWLINARGIQRLPDRCAGTTASPSDSAVPATDPVCAPHWSVDAKGIRQLSPDCVQTEAPPAGAATVAPTATTSTARPRATVSRSRGRPGCDPPTYTDANGLQRVKRKCL